MSDKQETIADIIAEMRGFKRYAASDSNDCRYVAYWLYQTFADRLEAAHKRERGNAAKLREALALIATIEFPHNFQNERFDIADACQDLTNAIKTACAALAAPPRNCDRPECATTKAAQDVWRKEDGGKTAYYEWLLATTTKKEGGAK